ncbi:cyclic nucleotide-binding domain-containing protein [Enterovirga sp. CN4-39]|uniref:cyclic nucleotide-binding domain-containing protein n=1 Tax=Enterovirga sp. CN4-39 TaxID=3400910 RepID=UPI003C0915DF
MAIETTLSILRRAPILGLFEDEALRVIANVADTRRLRPGEVLFRHGDRSDGGYVVTAGTIAVGRAGAEEPVLLGPASVIGEIALFIRMQRPATATAQEAASVLRISPTLMKRVLHEFPSAAPAMAEVLTRDLEAVAAGLTSVERLFAEQEASERESRGHRDVV